MAVAEMEGVRLEASAVRSTMRASEPEEPLRESWPARSTARAGLTVTGSLPAPVLVAGVVLLAAEEVTVTLSAAEPRRTLSVPSVVKEMGAGERPVTEELEIVGE